MKKSRRAFVIGSTEVLCEDGSSQLHSGIWRLNLTKMGVERRVWIKNNKIKAHHLTEMVEAFIYFSFSQIFFLPVELVALKTCQACWGETPGIWWRSRFPDVKHLFTAKDLHRSKTNRLGSAHSFVFGPDVDWWPFWGGPCPPLGWPLQNNAL